MLSAISSAAFHPGWDLAHAQAQFGLSARQAQRIADLRPREQLLLARPDVSTVLSLRVDPTSQDLFTNRPFHHAPTQEDMA
jgi:hypothetical protein